MNTKVFRSRISVLLMGIVSVTFIFALAQIYQQMRYNDFFIFIGIFVVAVFILSGTHYVVSENELHVKIWFIPCGKSVNIADIVSVKRSYSPLSSPALSLKRLRICCKKESYPYLLISPVREQEFVELLKTINPDIQINIPDSKGKWWVM